MTWTELRTTAEAELRAAGVEQPAVEARWLLEQVSGLDAAEQAAQGSAPATERATAALRALVERRVAGEPLQYVLGSWGFCGLDLLVDRRVLIPRPETEVVARVAIEEVRRLGERVGRPDAWGGGLTHYAVADLGTGSGALALALARALPEAEVWATDVSEDALNVAYANVAGTGTAATRVRIVAGAWFEALPTDLRGHLLLIVSNPPYVASGELDDLPDEVAEWEPIGALVSGPTGLEAIEVIVAGAAEWRGPTGVIVLELAPHQAPAAIELARGAGFAAVHVEADLAGRDRVLVARRAG